LAAGLAAVVVLAVVVLSTGNAYVVRAQFPTASQLVKGDLVQVSGRGIGTVTGIDLTRSGQAEITMKIKDGGFRPLREGTHATIRQSSLSGVASRYIDLSIPDASHTKKIPDGGLIPAAQTTTIVDLDQIFDTFDSPTRNALRDVIRRFNDLFDRRAAEANLGWMYLNPTLAATSRLFRELDSDTPQFRSFIVDTSHLVTDLAARREHLAGLVDHLAITLGAIGRHKDSLGEAVGRLPTFLRRANTTFVNLRATLDDLTPLVNESKPVAKKLQPFLRELRPFARDARPTLRDLASIIRRPGADNDLIEATRNTPAARDIAIGPVTANGRQREGAFPASTRALNKSTPLLTNARPYAVDLTGWFDDFSHSGIYDALGGVSRVGLHVNAFAFLDGVLAPIPPDMREQVFHSVASTGQRDRCPGAAERGAVWKPRPDFPCDETQVPPGR
jgi:phospholipid/cholesterol/gamma-HCH transport system substrate-binding protein